MMYLKIGICDDESNQTEYLTSMVTKWGAITERCCDVRAFSSVEAFLFAYEDDKAYDILLLDVEMKNITGVELARQIRLSDHAVQIIFITGYPDFMSEGYEVEALHYLLKPVGENKLFSVLDRAAAHLDRGKPRIKITCNRCTEYIPLSELLYIESQKQYIEIHTTMKTYRIKGSLAETAQALDDHFFQCQRSFIINLNYVERINTDHVILKGGQAVPISRGMAEKIGKEIIRLF